MDPRRAEHDGDAGGECRHGQLLGLPGEPQMLPNGNLAFTSGGLGPGTNPAGQSIEVLPNGTRIYVQQMSEYEYRSYFESTLYGPPPTSSTPALSPDSGDGPFAYQYHPDRHGVELQRHGRRGGQRQHFTAGNPTPAGQPGRLPPEDRLDQPVGGFRRRPAPTRSTSTPPSGATSAPAMRSSRCWSTARGGTFTPAGTSYATYTTASFTCRRQPTISFVGVIPAELPTSTSSTRSPSTTFRRQASRTLV